MAKEPVKFLRTTYKAEEMRKPKRLEPSDRGTFVQHLPRRSMTVIVHCHRTERPAFEIAADEIAGAVGNQHAAARCGRLKISCQDHCVTDGAWFAAAGKAQM